MAAPPIDDISGLGAAIETLAKWIGLPLGGGAIGWAYLAGRQVQEMRSTQTDHGRRLGDHDRALDGLERDQNDGMHRLEAKIDANHAQVVGLLVKMAGDLKD